MARVMNKGVMWEFSLETPEELAWAKERGGLEPQHWSGPRTFITNPQEGSEIVLRMRSSGLDVEPESDLN